MKIVDAKQDSEVPSCSRRFKFDGLYGNIFLNVVLPLLLFSISIRELFYGHYLGAMALVAAMCFFLALGYIQVFYNADIIIDEDWVSRFAFGRMIQKIRWSNIKLIRISKEFGGSGCSYNVYPIEKKYSHLGVIGKLAFGDGMEDSVEFIKLMNLNIAKYNIKIENVAEGTKSFPLKLPAIKNGRPEKIDLSNLNL